MKKIAEFVHHPKPWGAYEFPWGSAVRHEPNGKWHKIYIRLGDKSQEIDVSEIDVTLHDNGIEFS